MRGNKLVKLFGRALLPSAGPRNRLIEADLISLTPNPSPKNSINVGSAKIAFRFEFSGEGSEDIYVDTIAQRGWHHCVNH